MKVGICNTNHFIFIDDGRADDRGVDGITRVVRTNTNIDFILLQFFYNLRIIDTCKYMNLYVRIMMTEIIHKFRYPVNADAGAGSKADIARSQSIDRCDFFIEMLVALYNSVCKGKKVSSVVCKFDSVRIFINNGKPISRSMREMAWLIADLVR